MMQYELILTQQYFCRCPVLGATAATATVPPPPRLRH